MKSTSLSVGVLSLLAGVATLAQSQRYTVDDLGTLPGKSIRNYLPSLINIPAAGDSGQLFRTAMQCRGRRQDGEAFLADIWFSTYRTSAGRRLAAMVVTTDVAVPEEAVREIVASEGFVNGWAVDLG